MKNIAFLLVAAVLVFTGCEEVIILDLENDEPQLVIEAVVDANTGTAAALITKSNGFYDDIALDVVNDATVTLTLENGNQIDLAFVNDGQYVANGFTVADGEELSIEVATNDGLAYQATTFVPHNVSIDSVQVVEALGGGPGNPGGGLGGNGVTQYQLFTHWKDVANEESFYRIRALENDTLKTNIYTLIDDVENDGEQLFRPFFDTFDSGSTATIQLLSLDESTYSYFSDLSAIQGQGFSSTTPFNPYSNWSEGALGYFGAMRMDVAMVVLP